jgi:hypothetical protein
VTTRLVLSAIFLLQALVIYFVVTQRFPISGDDYSYMYQAKLFAAGKLYAEDALYDHASPLHNCVGTSCLKDFHGHRFSQYPPGWPLILAIGAALSVPWIVNPLLGALLVFLMLRYVERQMGKELVTVTWLLLTLCFFFVYYAASTRAHIVTALFVFSAFLAYDRSERQSRLAWMWLLVAGAFLGYSSMIRYIDWIPLGVWIGASLVYRRNLVGLALFAVGFILLATGNLLYDTLLSGNPFQPPTTINGTIGTNGRLVISWAGLQMTGERLAYLLAIFPPVLLLGVFCRRYRPSPRVKMYLILFLMNVGIYFFYAASAGGPGPRYFLAYFPFLVLAVVDLCRWIYREGTADARQLWRLGLACLLIGNVVYLAVEGHTIYGRRDLERAEKQAGPGKKIFLLKSGSYLTSASDLTRNPPDLSTAENLYFHWCTQSQRDALLELFPGRKVYVYEYPAHLDPYVPDPM